MVSITLSVNQINLAPVKTGNLLTMLCRTEKEVLKALETPEEKRARRMAKKVNLYWYIVLAMKDRNSSLLNVPSYRKSR